MKSMAGMGVLIDRLFGDGGKAAAALEACVGKTSTLVTHNEHNGYYGGFAVRAEVAE